MPHPDLVITLETASPPRGRYVASVPGQRDSEMTFLRRPDGVMVIDHTGVPPELEGRGIALALVKKAVADARAEGFKIEPLCSYVVAQFRRHPDWEDVRA